MATWIKVDGSREEITPANGESFELSELHAFVGGYIEVLHLPSGQWLVLNEEGKLLGLPENGAATLLGRACGTAPDDYVVGDVLVCSSRELGEDEEY